MTWSLLPLNYLTWHYGRGLVDAVRVLRNLLWFLYHFFSLPILTATFFQPWRRLHENYSSILDTEDWVVTLIANALMRLFGMAMRLIMIVVGAMLLAVALIVASLLLLVWLAIPAVLLIMFGAALNLLTG